MAAGKTKTSLEYLAFCSPSSARTKRTAVTHSFNKTTTTVKKLNKILRIKNK